MGSALIILLLMQSNALVRTGVGNLFHTADRFWFQPDIILRTDPS